MHRKSWLAVSVVAVLGLVSAAALAVPGFRTGGSGSIACGDGTVTWSPTTIWPPNHKMTTVTINFVDGEDDGDTNTITVDAILHDQADSDGANELPGSGQPVDQQGLDWSGVGNSGTAEDPETATTTAQVRAERSGTTKTGRTYTITVTCTQANGDDTTTETVNLVTKVPHNQGKGKGASSPPPKGGKAK